MLAECEAGGEARVREYAWALDNWDGDIVVGRTAIDATGPALPAWMREDIQFASARVKR